MERLRRALSILPPWMFSVLTFLTIMWLTLAPKPLGDNPPQLFPGADKIVHAIMFWGFATMIDLDFQRKNGWRKISLYVILLASAISFGVGILVEYLQLNMGMGRGFETNDIIADCCGCIVAAIDWIEFQKYWSRK